MAQISIRNNLLKRYNNKFRRNERMFVRPSRQRRSRLLVVVGMQACDDQLEESRVPSLLT